MNHQAVQNPSQIACRGLRSAVHTLWRAPELTALMPPYWTHASLLVLTRGGEEQQLQGKDRRRTNEKVNLLERQHLVGAIANDLAGGCSVPPGRLCRAAAAAARAASAAGKAAGEPEAAAEGRRRSVSRCS